jgi:hypothetical protein
MHEHSYQNDATAKQAIVGKNKQIFTLKVNIYTTRMDFTRDMDN